MIIHKVLLSMVPESVLHAIDCEMICRLAMRATIESLIAMFTHYNHTANLRI